MSRKPIVYIPCNRSDINGASTHCVQHQFIRPMLEIVNSIPLLIPANGESFNLDNLDNISGILLTGAASNINPKKYGAKLNFEESLIDNDRDSLTLPLINDILERDIPLLAICRGYQEMNIALGGTLHQKVQEVKGKLDHRANYDLPVKERFEEHKHRVTLQKSGVLESIGLDKEFTVNSIHQQGIDKLAEGIFIEAIAEDGLIESFSVPNKKFALGVQWHPEGDFWQNENSVKIFEAFKAAL